MYSTGFVVKASVPPYEAREALYAESVVRKDKWTTGEVLNHIWQSRREPEINAVADAGFLEGGSIIISRA